MNLKGANLTFSKELQPGEKYIEFAKIGKSIEKNKKYIAKVRNEKGEERWVEYGVMPLFDEKNNKIDDVVVSYDITQQKELERLATTDGLTDLYNRRFFNVTLTRELNRARRDKTFLTFLILDVDYFKKYNDSYGHDAGDKVLIAIANAIKNSIKRGGDFAFRLGGEEFGVLFSKINIKNSLVVAEKIRKNIENLNIEHSSSPVANHVTVSIGLIVVDLGSESVDEHGLYTMADDALYEAKEHGRNQVVLYDNNELDFF